MTETTNLSEEDIIALSQAKVDPKHDHLNDELESETTFFTDERLEWLSEFFKNLSIFCAGTLLGTYL